MGSCWDDRKAQPNNHADICGEGWGTNNKLAFPSTGVAHEEVLLGERELLDELSSHVVTRCVNRYMQLLVCRKSPILLLGHWPGIRAISSFLLHQQLSLL